MTTKSISFLAALSCVVLLGGAAGSQSVDVDPSVQSSRGGTREINLGLATGGDTYLNGGTAIIHVLESRQRRDLNGDGDMEDAVIHVFDASSGEVRNLGLTIPASVTLADDLVFSFPPLLEGRLLAFVAGEDGGDLNGDGDTNDSVVHVYDTVRRSVLNLRLALLIPPLAFDGRFMAMDVFELDQGRDLNQDGDLDDFVLHVFDVVTRRTQNTALAVVGLIPDFFTPAEPTRNQIAFLVSERDQGGIDLNGDGDARDFVAHLLDKAGRVRNLRLAGTSGLDAGAGVVLVTVPEQVDLNGDQDVNDRVLHVVDIDSGRIRNTGLSIGFELLTFDREQGFVLVNVQESEQGTDLNGDGNLDDRALFVVSRSGQVRNLQVNATALAAANGRAVLVRQESDAGQDLNGDGDLADSVVSLADLSRTVPRIVNTGLAFSVTAPGTFLDPTALQLRDDLATFLVSEAEQGNRDLNADGDTADVVLHISDLSSLTTRNSGLDGSFAYRTVLAPLLPPSDGRVVVPVRESKQGGRDLNRDGDADDMVLQILDLRSGRARNTGLAIATDVSLPFEVPLMIRGETFVSALVPESRVDLNGDGDTTDRVLHILDIETGKITNVGLAARADAGQENDLDFSFAGVSDTFGLLLELSFGRLRSNPVGPGLGDAFTFLVSEAAQGNVDLNGDGDTNDTVVHATRLTDRDRNGRFDFAEANTPRAGE